MKLHLAYTIYPKYMYFELLSTRKIVQGLKMFKAPYYHGLDNLLYVFRSKLNIIKFQMRMRIIWASKLSVFCRCRVICVCGGGGGELFYLVVIVYVHEHSPLRRQRIVERLR